jgi:Urease alpha-subunit, N-terminal domain
MTGPTAGDLIELADTGLVIRVEADAQQAGDEFRTGFGKTARDGMHLRAATATATACWPRRAPSTPTCTCCPRASWKPRCRPG